MKCEILNDGKYCVGISSLQNTMSNKKTVKFLIESLICLGDSLLFNIFIYEITYDRYDEKKKIGMWPLCISFGSNIKYKNWRQGLIFGLFSGFQKKKKQFLSWTNLTLLTRRIRHKIHRFSQFFAQKQKKTRNDPIYMQTF